MATETENHWHLDKKVPVGIILLVISQAIGGMWLLADIKKDVELLKAAQTEQRVRDERQDKTTYEAITLVRQDIRELSQKIDRIIERAR